MPDEMDIPLIDYVNEKFAELNRHVDNKFIELERSIARETEVLKETEERHHANHDREHQLAQLAIDKAEQSIREKLAAMNEFRDALNDQSATMARRDQLDGAIAKISDSLDERMRAMEAAGIGRLNTAMVRIDRLELETNRRFGEVEKGRLALSDSDALNANKWSNLEGRMYMLTAVMGFLLFLITVISFIVQVVMR